MAASRVWKVDLTQLVDLEGFVRGSRSGFARKQPSASYSTTRPNGVWRGMTTALSESFQTSMLVRVWSTIEV